MVVYLNEFFIFFLDEKNEAKKIKTLFCKPTVLNFNFSHAAKLVPI